jgi:hypothetical protein
MDQNSRAVPRWQWKVGAKFAMGIELENSQPAVALRNV